MPTQTVVESFTERELAAWRRFLRTHAGLVKELDADLEAVPTKTLRLTTTQHTHSGVAMNEALLYLAGVIRLTFRPQQFWP